MTPERRIAMRAATRRCYRKYIEARRIASRLSYYKNRERALRSTRNSNLKKAFGIGLEEYERRFAAQGGMCKICGVELEKSKSRKGRHLDHNHETGAIRDFLCGGCNLGIGFFGESIGKLEQAIKYLREHGACG